MKRRKLSVQGSEMCRPIKPNALQKSFVRLGRRNHKTAPFEETVDEERTAHEVPQRVGEGW